VGGRNSRRSKLLYGEQQIMIKISHRGNTSGPIESLENKPEYLLNAISLGFDVEVDVWVLNGIMYFGHDEAKYIVDPTVFYRIVNQAWFHCKNIEALNHFITMHPTSRFFWHQQDDYTLTSNGYIWTYPDKEITNKTIIVDLKGSRDVTGAFGLCSDFLL